MEYIIVGKFSKIDIEKLIVKDDFGKPIINQKLIQTLVVSAFSVIVFAALSDYAHAAPEIYQNPTKLDAIFDFLKWFITLIKYVFSGVLGVIFAVAGWKWGTDLSGGGQTTAKTIMKNCLIGLFITWTGSIIGETFVGKLESILSGY